MYVQACACCRTCVACCDSVFGFLIVLLCQNLRATCKGAGWISDYVQCTAAATDALWSQHGVLAVLPVTVVLGVLA